MEIIVDGLKRDVPEAASLAEVLDLLGEPLPHVVVELNGRYVPSSDYGEVKLGPGDRLEVILPAFGG